MVQLRPNARGRYEEVVPAACRNGHPLGVGRMTNGMDEHPTHGIRVRTWECRQCGDVAYAKPDDWQLPRGQYGPTADYGGVTTHVQS